ncbi:MAG: CRISPR-associated endonuclease Cas6 [Blastocatellia bacterium]
MSEKVIENNSINNIINNSNIIIDKYINSKSNNIGSCNIALVRLKTEERVKHSNSTRAHQLRGAISEKFDEPIFHNHVDNKLVYSYPLIQYRWDVEKACGVIAGFNEGAERITKIPWLDLELTLGNKAFHIAEAEISYHRNSIGLSDRLARYNFISPWLPFNQENYGKYQNLSLAEQRKELDRLLIAQLLITLKGLQIRVNQQLYAAFELKNAVTVLYKEQNLVGFFGYFVTNLVLPNDLAIGKAVSHGYGWLTSFS